MMIVFPLLEQGLRRIYVSINRVEDMLWTADSRVVYSTMDVLLDKTVPVTVNDDGSNHYVINENKSHITMFNWKKYMSTMTSTTRQKN